MQVQRKLTQADIEKVEAEVGATRAVREKNAMDKALNAGIQGSLLVGGAGVLGHIAGQKFCA